MPNTGGIAMTLVAKMPTTAKVRGRVAPVKLAHFVLRTRPEKKQTLVDWYRTVLEAEPMCDSENITFLAYDQEHHRVAIIGQPGLKERVDGCVGVHHIAFTYAGLGDLVHTYERLKRQGIRPEFSINHGPTTSMYYFDPDKNTVELQVDNVPEERFAEYFENGEFADNPIGIRFDPDDLAARYRAGVPESDLLKRPRGVAPSLEEFPRS
jgi:catechol 2,3-dioxygenase-like lactoylglutathione lyase family enzyme